MNTAEAGEYWDQNAEAWTVLSRAGHDVYRDHLNTPAFMEILPGIKGLTGIDIGCGEGHNTRLLASKGAFMSGIDISPVFIQHAVAAETERPLHIQYKTASATSLPFADNSFDFATSFMCFMDIPETAAALREAYRVIKPGGFLQFSIVHPCFSTPHRKNLRNAEGITYAIEAGGYFNTLEGEIEEWIFGNAPEDLRNQFPKFKVPRFTRTLSQWINYCIAAGFTIEQVNEPCPSAETIQQYPYLQDSSVVAYFLHIRCRKSQLT